MRLIAPPSTSSSNHQWNVVWSTVARVLENLVTT